MRVRSLSEETANQSRKGAADDLDHRAFANERAGVKLKIAFDEASDALDFLFGNDGGFSAERHDAHDASASENAKSRIVLEPGEAVSREERPVDLLLPISPGTPPRNGRKK
jgi:hypothetical protein